MQKIIISETAEKINEIAKIIYLERRYLLLLEINREKQIVSKMDLINLYFQWRYFYDQKKKIINDYKIIYNLNPQYIDIDADCSSDEIIIVYE